MSDLSIARRFNRFLIQRNERSILQKPTDLSSKGLMNLPTKASDNQDLKSLPFPKKSSPSGVLLRYSFAIKNPTSSSAEKAVADDVFLLLLQNDRFKGEAGGDRDFNNGKQNFDRTPPSDPIGRVPDTHA
jgi:hypothetical protein